MHVHKLKNQNNVNITILILILYSVCFCKLYKLILNSVLTRSCDAAVVYM